METFREGGCSFTPMCVFCCYAFALVCVRLTLYLASFVGHSYDVVGHSYHRMGGVETGFPDYLIKWQGLPYSDCTWEDGELINKLDKVHIPEYEKRNKSQKIPNPKFCKVGQQLKLYVEFIM